MFSIFDQQTGRYLNTGRNKSTRQESVNDGFEYLISGDDWDMPEVFEAQKDKEGCLAAAELTIEEHEEEIN